MGSCAAISLGLWVLYISTISTSPAASCCLYQFSCATFISNHFTTHCNEIVALSDVPDAHSKTPLSRSHLFYASTSGLSVAFVNLKPLVPGHVLVPCLGAQFIGRYGGFRSLAGYPQITHSERIFHIEIIQLWGYLDFWNPPYWD